MIRELIRDWPDCLARGSFKCVRRIAAVAVAAGSYVDGHDRLLIISCTLSALCVCAPTRRACGLVVVSVRCVGWGARPTRVEIVTSQQCLANDSNEVVRG